MSYLCVITLLSMMDMRVCCLIVIMKKYSKIYVFNCILSCYKTTLLHALHLTWHDVGHSVDDIKSPSR